jgi:pre-mRNA-splicing factor CDC5/CEF1
MRILIKGGVWKNTEDEILKAAVMKYGKNQWARVASLLSRKSAKQCKARWYEWLDPSIKKTEWSREEEEKLLHLAKLMPNQWRTIAPIVGRTAGQCMEQYERLLDMAQEGKELDASEDPRRLRPGEIDPAPETKPARPDPVDMDEDEKEMLAEARARLANTKGKKAKRKARERQMEESRRLSMLQKRRELKAAGIEMRLGTGSKKRKYIDYGKEIPFQKAVPAGFYDVTEETENARIANLDRANQVIELAKLEGRHQKEEEEREREKDKKRMKSLFKANAAQAVMKISEQNDPLNIRRRTPLSLPAPQVTDNELEDIVKVSQNSLMLPPSSDASVRDDATRSLMGDYSRQMNNAIPTPQRTPLQENIVMQEARNLRALREMAPLSGDELPELLEGTGFEGINPRVARLATPNTVLGTPARNSVAATPASVMSSDVSVIGSQFSGVGNKSGNKSRPLIRDALGLNDPNSDSFSVAEMSSVATGAMSRADKYMELERRQNIADQLKQLPQPDYSYEIAIPEGSEENDMVIDDKGTSAEVEDATEVEERNRSAMEAEKKRLEERKSSVLKRNLPRPLLNPLVHDITKNQIKILHASSMDYNEAMQLYKGESKQIYSVEDLILASSMIGEETEKLIRYDDIRNPHDKSVTDNGSYQYVALYEDTIQNISNEELASAKAAIQWEYEKIKDSITFDLSEFNNTWEEVHKKYMFLPSKSCFGIPENKQEVSIRVYHISNVFLLLMGQFFQVLNSLASQFSVLSNRIAKV